MSVNRLGWLPSVLVLLAASQTVWAQPPQVDSRVVQPGGKIGLGIVTWGGADADDDFLSTVEKIGFSVGAFAKIGLNALFKLDTGPVALLIQPELSYVAKGAGIEIDGEDVGEFRSSYVAVALLPRVEYALATRVTPYVVLGPALGLMLNAELENRIGMVTNIEDNFTSTDFGLVLGLGADVPISAYGTLVFELRADVGLTSIDGQGDGDDIKNRAYSLMVGYQY